MPSRYRYLFRIQLDYTELAEGMQDNTREFKQNSRGRRRQRRQNNTTNNTRQKAHVNMWNKVDIRQLLHFHVVCKTWSTFQELSSIFSFRKRRWKQLKSAKIETNSGTKANTSSEKHKDYGEIFLLLADFAVVIVGCFINSLLIEWMEKASQKLHISKLKCGVSVSYYIW